MQSNFVDVDNSNASWLIDMGDRIMIRDRGKVIYDGPPDKMSPEIAAIAAEFNTKHPLVDKIYEKNQLETR